MDERPMDLRSEEGETSTFDIPIKIAAIISALLVISGLFVGILIPELTSEESDPKVEDNKNILDTISISTLDRLECLDRTYTDISIPEAYYITVTEDSNISGVDSIVHDYLSFMLEEVDGFEFTASRGQNFPIEFERLITEGNTNGGATEITSTEILVDIDGDGNELRMDLTLKIWKEGS